MAPRLENPQEKPLDEAELSSTGKRCMADANFSPEVPVTLHGKTLPDVITSGSEPRQFYEYNLPGVRFCRWFQFKNRYADEDYSSITIEALVGPPDLSSEISVDEHRRFIADKTETQQFPPGLADYHPPQNMREVILHRVRLRSAAVLKRLSVTAQADSDWSRQPTTFMRPFNEFIHYYDKMKIDLERAKVTVAEATSLQRDYEELQQFITFVEKAILPLKAAWDLHSPKTPSKIRHSDLPYLFRPGELLYIKNEGQSHAYGSDMPPGIRMHIASTFSIGSMLDRRRAESFLDTYHTMRVKVYHIDFDGRAFRPVIETHGITWYAGEVEVRSLDIYPLRFEPDADRMLTECQAYGKRFRNFCSGQPHWFHSGWTIAKITLNRESSYIYYTREDRDREPVLNSEFIDSEVIIDFREAMKALKWNPNFQALSSRGRASAETTTDMWSILTWTDRQSTNTKSTVSESIVTDCDLGTIEELEIVNRQSILSKGFVDKEGLSDLQLALLPRRVLVYSLRDRRFVGAHIDSLTEVRNADGGFKNLRINTSHLRMIKSLVKNHFDTKRLEKQKGAEMTGQDFIHGKGRGVVVLLHGVPGVGKTATAEAVAQEYSKPLFPITCGDLGITPEAVSKNLMNIFRLASLWGCVLLLDEADVFLSRREQKGDDLVRNALVSVFLRVLEYYNGILFLTTNRPGTLDEAVKSRVHTSFYYPYLNWDQTRDIFKLNIERLRRIEDQRAEAGGESLVILENQIMRFAKDHFYSHTDYEGRWNGRQIRNAFQVAAGLAHLEDDDEREQDRDVQKQLGTLQFQEVADTIVNYDRFRAKVLGKHDDEIARERMERPARFDDGGAPKDQTRAAGYRSGAGSEGGGGGHGWRMRDRDDYPAERGGFERHGNYAEVPGPGPSGGYGRHAQHAQKSRDWAAGPPEQERRVRERDVDEEYTPQGRYGAERPPRARDEGYSTEETLSRTAGDATLVYERGGAIVNRKVPRDRAVPGELYGSQEEEPVQDEKYR